MIFSYSFNSFFAYINYSFKSEKNVFIFSSLQVFKWIGCKSAVWINRTDKTTDTTKIVNVSKFSIKLLQLAQQR